MNDKNFFQQVYEIVRLIPLGRVASYGAIAKALGSPQSARMVGWAMNQSHFEAIYVPAHRVVNRNGYLTGKHHFDTQSAMAHLLQSEGITVVNDKIIDFKNHFWDPVKELDISLF